MTNDVENELYCLGRAISSAVESFCLCSDHGVIESCGQCYIREEELKSLIYKITTKYIADRRIRELDKYDNRR